uniref:Uncharacterized protein n=1 Tax=Cacopsylla melanoneura TaxID=428564 RepID=A0A8D8WBB0_9HEMI
MEINNAKPVPILKPDSDNSRITSNKVNYLMNLYNRPRSFSLVDYIQTTPDEQLTPERVRRGDGYETSDTFSDAEESRNESDGECVPTVSTKVPVRNLRKKSVMPPRQEMKQMSSLPSSSPRRQRKEVMLPLDRSPSNSMTSINSISSLLREKLVMMNLTRVIKHVKSQSEYKLKSFVVFLFLIISLLVGFAHVLYQQHRKTCARKT